MSTAMRPISELLQEAKLTPMEVSRISRRHYQTVVKALRSGELPGVQYAKNGNWYINTADALAWTPKAQGRPADTHTMIGQKA